MCDTCDYMKMVAQYLIHCFPFPPFFLILFGSYFFVVILEFYSVTQDYLKMVAQHLIHGSLSAFQNISLFLLFFSHFFFSFLGFFHRNLTQCVTHDYMKMVAKHLIHCPLFLSFFPSFVFVFFFYICW